MKMLKTGLKCVFAVSLIFGLVGCEDSEAIKRDQALKELEIKTCVGAGGVPIRSIWDNRLKDCIFPPQKAT